MNDATAAPLTHVDRTEPADPFAPDALVFVAPIECESSVVKFSNFLPKPNPSARPVLALDLGTACGVALRTAGGVASSTVDLKQRTRDTRGDRLARFWRFLWDVQRSTPLALVAYEDVAHMGPGQLMAAHAHAQFEGVLMLFAARAGVEIKNVHTGTLKKAITGKGAWPKGEGKARMLAAVQALGYTPDTQDEADAIAVLEWATR